MKHLIFILLWVLSCLCALGASPSFQQTTNMPAYFAQNLVRVGNSNTGFTITATNSTGLGQGMPFVLWNTILDLNTNQVQMTNNTAASTFNQAFAFLSTSNLYVSLGGTARFITNRQDFSITNYLGSTVTNYWATIVNIGSSVINQFTTNLNGGQWYIGATGVPTNTSSFFPTNSLKNIQTFGSATNEAGLSNTMSAIITSNGFPFIVTTPVGSTNLTWTPLLPLYFPSAQSVTNMYTTNVTLDFPSTSANVAVLPVTITGTALGDTVIVNQAGDNNLAINGTFSGSASNDTVFVRFNAVGAAQDPASQLFRITVLKAR